MALSWMLLAEIYTATGGYDCRVRKIDLTTGIITTVAGIGYLGYNGDEIPAKQAFRLDTFGI